MYITVYYNGKKFKALKEYADQSNIKDGCVFTDVEKLSEFLFKSNLQILVNELIEAVLNSKEPKVSFYDFTSVPNFTPNTFDKDFYEECIAIVQVNDLHRLSKAVVQVKEILKRQDARNRFVAEGEKESLKRFMYLTYGSI